MVLPPISENAQNTDDSQNKPANVAIVCPLKHLPTNLSAIMKRKGINGVWINDYKLSEKDNSLEECELVIIYPNTPSNIEQRRELGKFLQTVQRKGISILLLSHDKSLANFIVLENDTLKSHVQFANPDAPSEEIWGRICSMLDYSPIFVRIDRYLGQLEQWAFSLNRRFEELHQELRLAWRVQQDFLPKKLPDNENLMFSALYRPATWVSGDIYDIFQLDEDNIGFYIADVVGHGVAAGLMTLFAKRALMTKEITENGYRLLTADEALMNLNAHLCSLELPEHQFMTACYGIINKHSRKVSFARGGHPHPILLTPDGQTTQLIVDGALLGVMEDMTFPTYEFTLEKGSKLIIFTDGLEQEFPNGNDGEEALMRKLSEMAKMSAKQITDSINGFLDCKESSLHPDDDITVIVIEAK